MKWIPKNKELLAFLNTGAKVTAASHNENHAKVTAAVMAATANESSSGGRRVQAKDDSVQQPHGTDLSIMGSMLYVGSPLYSSTEST